MDPIEGEFICRKCQTPLNISKIIVSRKGFAIFEVKCQRKHTGKRKFNMAQQNEWMPAVIKHLYMCPRCSSNLTDVRQKTDGDRTVLLLNCSTHGKIKKIVSTSFWYAMDALRKQLASKPAYPFGFPGSYPQQYPPGSYSSTYQQPGYPPQQSPATPYGSTQPGKYPTTQSGSQPPPETISPPQLETAPPTQPPVSPSSPSTIELPSSGDTINAGGICPACGEPISPGAKFCTNCGTELE